MKAIRYENEQVFEWAAAKFGATKPGDYFGNNLTAADIIQRRALPERRRRKGYKSKNKPRNPKDIVNKVRTKDNISIEQTREGNIYLSKGTTRLLYTKSYGTTNALKDFREFITTKNEIVLR
jgi:hypothetical protein